MEKYPIIEIESLCKKYPFSAQDIRNAFVCFREKTEEVLKFCASHPNYDDVLQTLIRLWHQNHPLPKETYCKLRESLVELSKDRYRSIYYHSKKYPEK